MGARLPFPGNSNGTKAGNAFPYEPVWFDYDA
jgi:hypothetical protein